MRTLLHLPQSIRYPLLLALLLVLPSLPAVAHEIRPAIIDLTIGSDGTLTLVQRINLETLLAGIGEQHSDTDDSPQAGRYRSLRALPPDELHPHFERFLPTLLAGSQLTADGERISLKLGEVTIPPVGDSALSRDSLIRLSGTLPAGAAQLRWQWQRSFGASVLRVSDDAGREIYSDYLPAGKVSGIIPAGGAGAADTAQRNGFADYVTIGFQHILPKGLDHILFVIGLFLLNARISSLLWQVTAFTLAHTLTLALAIYGVLAMPASVVEPLIAASIIYVCVENLFSSEMSRWRPLVVFLFGLLHGLGFAGVLREIGLAPDRFLSGLIGFNIGVELGQLAVIGGCFLAVGLWFRHRPWYRRLITLPASLVIALIGGYWFLERTMVGI